MRHFANVEVGVATHTGRVRRTNEDDFLLCAPQDREELLARGWVIAIADGMGGAAGGAEASRTAVRAAIRPFLDSPNGDAAARMHTGFDAAVSQVYEFSQENPTLRGMGTTLTIVNLLGDRMVLGHVGDTRCLRIRDASVEQLSEDHAVREPDNYLTRCIGAGQQDVKADIDEFDVLDDDRYVLLTDGLWAVVPDTAVRDLVLGMAPQAAADELVRLANRRGGPDNSTVIILHVRSTTPDDQIVNVELPAEEVLQPTTLDQKGRSLMPPRWPWALLSLGLALIGAAIAKVWFHVDLVAWLGRLFA